jgi:hypothetical protein
VVEPPAFTEETPLDFVIARLAPPLTVVVVEALLFADVGSVGAVDETVAVFVIVAPFAVVAGTVAVIVTVAVAPGLRSPMAHVNVVVPAHPPLPTGDVFVHEPLAPVSGEGIGSETLTPFAVLGPVFVTVMEYVSVPPAVTGSGESLLVMLKSACAMIPPGFIAAFFSWLSPTRWA